MPLTEFQRVLLAELAKAPTDDRYLAGGAAMHFAPNSTRYSDDLDFFHDSEERVATAFAADRERLEQAGYGVDVEQSLPGFIRAIVRRGEHATRVDWAGKRPSRDSMENSPANTEQPSVSATSTSASTPTLR